MNKTIVVPATSANLGPGFDSLGWAVTMNLTVEIIEPSTNWSVMHSFGEDVASDERNLIVQTVLQVNPAIQPHVLNVTSDIPMSRGLGSSSSAIVAGIELANIIGEMNLSTHEKIQLATQIEGHPDNVVPAIVGGCVVAAYKAETKETFYTRKDIDDELALLAVIPSKKLATSASRNVLPQQFSHANASQASAIANLLVAAIWSNDWESAGRLFEQDLFHEPYRAQLVPRLATVRTFAQQHGAYGTYLSGAGSTIMVVCPHERVTTIEAALRQYIPVHCGVELRQLSIENRGVHVL